MSESQTAERPSFIRAQFEFAAHIRNPHKHPAPAGIEDRRMGIYREIFYNNIEGMLAGNFPVLREITADAQWHAMVRDFLHRHKSHTPLFHEVSQEFQAYLRDERGARPDDPPFLLELAHYEWVELALNFSDAQPPPCDPNGDIFAGVPVISPLAWNLSYRFAVQRIGPDYRPEQPEEQPTHLVVYRTRQDEVEFLEINAVTQRLIQLLKDNPDWTGQDAVKQIAIELEHPQPEVVMNGGRELLQALRNRDIIGGTRP